VTSSASTDYYDPYGQVFAVVGTGGVNIHALSGKASWVKYQQDSRFGALDINIENSGNTLAGRYYTNDGTNRDTFTISKGSTSFSGGTSLTLAGESAGTQTTASVDAKSNEITVTQSGQPTVTQPGQPTDTQSGQPSGTQPVQPDGQGKGLDCEHFKNQGPERCRTD